MQIEFEACVSKRKEPLFLKHRHNTSVLHGLFTVASEKVYYFLLCTKKSVHIGPRF